MDREEMISMAGPNDEMEHYKKRLIHHHQVDQGQQTILRESQSSVPQQPPRMDKKPKGQRGRKRKVVQMPLLKLGTGDPTALCKSRDTYSSSAENVHRQYENVTITGNAKKHRISEAAKEPQPSAGRHVLPAIVPGMPEIFGTGSNRGRRPNQRYQRRHSMYTSRSRNLELPAVPEGPTREQEGGHLRYADLERDITRMQNPMYPTDADMISAIQLLINSIVQRGEMSVDNLMVLNKFYCDLRRYQSSEKFADSDQKNKLSVQMAEVVDFVASHLIGYLDRYSVRYVKEMLSQNLQPHENFFREHAADIKQRAKSHVWLRTLMQKLSRPEPFEIPDDPVRLVDLKKLQSNTNEAPRADNSIPETRHDFIGVGTQEDPTQLPDYSMWQNANLPMTYLNSSVTITPVAAQSKKEPVASSLSAKDAPSTTVTAVEPTEEPADLTVKGTEDTPVKEEQGEEKNIVQYYAQELRKFKKLVKDTNAKVYKEVLKQYQDDDVYVVEDDNESESREEEPEQNRTADPPQPPTLPTCAGTSHAQPPNPFNVFIPPVAPPIEAPTFPLIFPPFPNCTQVTNVNPRMPSGAPRAPNPPRRRQRYIQPRLPAPSYPNVRPPVTEPLLELQRLNGGLGGAAPPPNVANPELPPRLQFTDFTVPPVVQTLRESDHFQSFYQLLRNNCAASMQYMNANGAPQETRNHPNVQQIGGAVPPYVLPSGAEPVNRQAPKLLEMRLDESAMLHMHPKLSGMIPRGQLYYEAKTNSLVLIVDERRTVCKLPRGVSFVEFDLYGDVEVYVKEYHDVFRFAPRNFAEYFRFVTWYQIYRRNNPITFKMFMLLHNGKYLQYYYNLYLKKMYECLMNGCHGPVPVPQGVV